MQGERIVRIGPFIVVAGAMVASVVAHASTASPPAAPTADAAVEESATQEGPKGPAASSPDAERPRARPRVLVLDFDRNDVDEGTAQVVLAALVEAMSARPEIEVISSRDLNQLADLEAERQAIGCDTSSCLAEIAGAMGARYVVFGALTKLDGLYVANLNLFDAERAEPVQRQSLQGEAARDLIEGAPKAARGLLTPLTRSSSSSSSSMSAVVEPAQESEGSLLFPIGLGTAAFGGVITLAGAGLAASAVAMGQTPSLDRATKDLAGVLLPVGVATLVAGVVGAAAGGGLTAFAVFE